MKAALENPYLADYEQLPRDEWEFGPSGARCFDFTTGRDLRAEFTARYAWAIPTQEAIERIVRESPVIEIGAGTGYWAYLVEQAGGDVIAFDERPVPDPENYWHMKSERSWFAVRRGGPESIIDHPDRTLFLCWPPHAMPMAMECLHVYRGRAFILVGEGNGGCTGDDDFWEELNMHWHQADSLDLPQWSGLHDYMMVFKRGTK